MSDRSTLDGSVLVLNRFYMAVRVCRRAPRDDAAVSGMCGSDHHRGRYRMPITISIAGVSFPNSMPLRNKKGRSFCGRLIRRSRFRGLCDWSCTQNSQVDRPIQSQELVRSRWLSMPVLRTDSADESVESRSCRAAFARARLPGRMSFAVCTNCNSKKGGRTPSEANMRLLSHPIRPHANPGLWRPWKIRVMLLGEPS